MNVLAPCHPPLVLSDEDLLARFAAGQHEGLDELFRRYRMVAYRIAFRLLGNEADALDAVQEGFVKALTHLEGFERRCSFKTWLLRVVSNAALDIGRQKRRRDKLRQELQAEDSSNGQPDGDAGLNLDQKELRRLLDGALAALPENQRRTFVLHAEAELSYREVADLLGISIGTVMSRLYYARRRLRDYLAQRIPT